jgi:hypothetical protein
VASRAAQQAVGLGQLTLDAGGATVDTSRIGSVKWGAETRDLEGQFRKGDDIAIALVARVVEVKLRDVYDAHGNVKETIREHVVRVDEQSAKVAKAEAFTVVADDPDAGDGEE